ncbi:MAG: hypothetical protein D3924_07740 [Candidatus Electrothrix sp. AR4]|nr:hypothetical protein [Candidatus Electrothrix sp. AR4]
MTFKNKKLNETLLNADVNITDKKRSNLFSWRGQFTPQLIEQLLLAYASKNDKIFDPFIGSGTVLFDCALLGLEASGCDINPAAIAFAKVYELINHSNNSVFDAIGIIELAVAKHTNSLPLVQDNVCSHLEKDIIQLYYDVKNKPEKIILLALITGMDFGNKEATIKRINHVWGTLRSNIELLPSTSKKICCYHADARKTPLKDSSIDFIITSPPYINVFNYHQNYRKSIEKIGIDILKVARSEIGSNRKFRPNRFLTVVQYCMDMSQVFSELRRVCKKDAKIIFIVGRESKVRNTSFKNASLINMIAQICGFKKVGEQTRVFMNKFGENIYEEILKFKISEAIPNNIIDKSRELGQEALKNALLYCDQKVVSEINIAIKKSENIKTSEFYNEQ